MNILIGSRAWEYWQSENDAKREKDWDIISDEPDKLPKQINGSRVEVFPFDTLYNKEIFLDAYKARQGIIIENVPITIAYPDELALIKRSHLHRPWFFRKHIAQYHNWSAHGRTMKQLVDEFSPEMKVMLNERTRLTKLEFGDKTPKLNVSNDQFFDDNVHKVFVHDDIHELMAHEDCPMYEHMKKPENMDQAWCSEDGWNKLTHKQKIQCVCEEAYVIGLERWLIPHFTGLMPIEDAIVPKVYFLQALEKVCTTLCSGWFRDFAIDSWSEIHNSFDSNKMMSFFNSDLWNNYTKGKD